MKIHEKYMLRCIQLAKNGLGTTYPNPLVGSVLVHNEKIIGEGFHHKAGLPHAEVKAIASVSEGRFLKDSSIYVSLEPCSHFGKTPPCADLIIEKGIKKVVIGSTDPNPKVAGRGIKKLVEAGCEVIVGILEHECNELNKRFFTFHSKKRPYIFLKWAETSNGFIAPKNETRKETKPVWITNQFSRLLVHKMRSEEMAILAGTNTVLQDNPSLTVRDWGGENLVRVVIDRTLKIPENFSVLDGKVETIVFNEKKSSEKENLKFVKIDFSEKLPKQICTVLYEKGIQSLIIEGGAQTIQTFIDENLWDEAYIFKGNVSFNEGLLAPTFKGDMQHQQSVTKNSLKIYKNQNS